MMKKNRDIIRALAMITQIGLSMAMCVILCIWGANFLREKLNLGSWVIIAGALLGAASAMYTLFKLADSINRR
ncbi:MAG: AtpZ/AtpI family protein [Clostridia bacterium]|nr:AtpZ/AtpI family protein [Clostridia bacterium]